MSIHPLNLIASDLLGASVEVSEIMSAQDDPHHHSLRFSQLHVLEHANLIFWMGKELEPSLANILSGRQDAHALLAHLRHVEGTRHSGHDNDLHYWMNPLYGIRIAELMVEQLARRHPEQEDFWLSRLSEFRDRIRLVDQESKGILTGSKRLYAATHNAYEHFGSRYGIGLAGALHDHAGVKVGSKAMAELLQSDKVGCVMTEPGYDQNSAVLARRLGVPIVKVDPLGRDIPAGPGSYQQFLQRITDSFLACTR